MITMSSHKTPSKPVRTIDYRWNRIRIHKQMLHLLGDPDYIELLVNPDTCAIAVRISSGDSDRSHSVNQAHKGKCIELHSAYLLRSLQSLSPQLIKGQTYRLYGSVIAAKGIVEFPISTIEQIREMEN